MRCYLVRHGEAMNAGDNPRRPLTADGRDDIDWIGRQAKERQVYIERICHSGILRAQETAEILAGHLRPKGGVRAISGLSPEDDPMIGRGEIESAGEPVLMVSHLPYVARLAALLVTGAEARPVAEFEPGTMVCLVKGPALWSLEWRLAPPSAIAG